MDPDQKVPEEDRDKEGAEKPMATMVTESQ